MSVKTRGAAFATSLLIVSVAQAQKPVLLRSAHFELSAPPGENTGQLLAALESAYKFVQASGVALPAMIGARSYATTSEFSRVARVPRFFLAVCVGKGLHLQPAGLLIRRGDLARALTHELVHVGLAEAAIRGLPRWFNEGVALNIAGEKPIVTRRYKSLDGLEGALIAAKDQPALRSAYGECARMVTALNRRLGMAGTLGIARQVASGKSFPDVFFAATGVSAEQWARQLFVAEN